MKHLVFAYGTLKNHDLRKKLLARNVPAEKDRLKGFSIEQIYLDGENYPVANYDPFNKNDIQGVSFYVNESELKILDYYESDAYKRIRVNLNSGRKAWLYVKP